jgi:hypothetical protein
MNRPRPQGSDPTLWTDDELVSLCWLGVVNRSNNFKVGDRIRGETTFTCWESKATYDLARPAITEILTRPSILNFPDLLLRVSLIYKFDDLAKQILSDPRADLNPNLFHPRVTISAYRCGSYETIKQIRNDPRFVLPEDYCWKHKLIYGLLKNSSSITPEQRLELIEPLLKDPRVDPSYKNNKVLRKVVVLYFYGHRHQIRFNDAFYYERVHPATLQIIRLLLNDPRVTITYYGPKKSSLNFHSRDDDDGGGYYRDERYRDERYDDHKCMAEYHPFFYSCMKRAENDESKLLKLLLPRVYDPGLANNYALRLAFYEDYREAINILLDDPRIDPSVPDNEPFILALANENFDACQRLLKDPRVDPSAQNSKAILIAAQHGDLNIVKLLLRDSRVDPSVKNNEAILIAIRKRHDSNIIKLLLSDSRVDPSVQNSKAFYVAAEYGYFEIVRMLFYDPRIDPTTNEFKALRMSIYCGGGFADIIKFLLRKHHKIREYARKVLWCHGSVRRMMAQVEVDMANVIRNKFYHDHVKYRIGNSGFLEAQRGFQNKLKEYNSV